METEPISLPLPPTSRQTPAFRAARQAFLQNLVPHAQRLGILSAGGWPEGDAWVLQVRALDPERLYAIPRTFRGFLVTIVPSRIWAGHKE